MSTFAYEYYKRNRAILQIGGIAAENVRLKKLGNGKFTTITQKGMLTTIQGYFEKAPTFNFEQIYSSEKSFLVEAVTQFQNMLQGIGAGLKNYPGKNTSEKALNFYNDFNNIGKGGGSKIWKDITNALSAQTDLNRAPGMMRWKGQDVIRFSVKFIFLDETGQGGPVFFDDKLKTLLSLVTYNGLDATDAGSWNMRGPIGYHGTVTGIGKLNFFLGQQFDRLHSLQLIKGTKEESSQVILDLRKILVIEKVNVQTSEQLYLDESGRGPAYKWITAEINFATACPIPNAFTDTPTNVSNFYGHNDGAEKDSKNYAIDD
jgi:hypothetical protein